MMHNHSIVILSEAKNLFRYWQCGLSVLGILRSLNARSE
jgi:hypothetical protein